MTPELLEQALCGGEHPGVGTELATHEAGHALVASLLGLPIRRAELLPEDRPDLAGVVSLHAGGDGPLRLVVGALDKARGHLHDAAVVLAGPLAAAQRWAIAVKVGARDRRQFQEAVASFRRQAPRGFRHEAGVVAERIEAVLRDMLATERVALDALAVGLAKRGRLSGAEVEKIVRENRARPTRDWPTALELAMSR